MRHLLPILAALLLTNALPAAIDYEGNLSRIPATDPKVEDAPTIPAALKGVHPRLMLNQQTIESLKAKVAADPLLKEIADKALSDSRRFKLPAKDPLPMVAERGDTAALSQSSGQWPSLAYAYAINPDPDTLEAISSVLRRMLEQPYWADTAELDSNMGAGCNLYAVSLLYDTAYADLDPTLRREVAERLLVQVRRLFYLGFQQLGLMPIKYWQQDPANNHRWYRLRGLSAALLAISDEPGFETSYLMQQLKKEVEFVMKWFPDEAECHEGAGYQKFGFRSILDTAIMMDNVLGTAYLKTESFDKAWMQQLYYWVPANNNSVSYGDSQNVGSVFQYDDAAFFISPTLSRDPDVQAALLRRFEKMAKHDDPNRRYFAPWSMLAYYDPTVETGDYKAVPTNHLFADMGAASFRDSWEDDAVIFTFKCGPYGGEALNAYRHANLNEQGMPHYINVAHDDPDANSFSLNVAGETIFSPGTYSTRKITRDNNTITLGDKGQIMEDSEWIQPVPDQDMRELSFLTGWKTDASGRAIIEGETGPAYEGHLDRFRRTAVWLPNNYILILDDVRPTQTVTEPITWRGVVPDGRFVEPETGSAKVVTPSGSEVPFQFIANLPATAALDEWFLPGRWGHQLLRQFQLSVEPAPARLATLIDPWNHGATMTYEQSDDTVTLTVQAGSATDVWVWKAAPDNKTPSSLIGTRNGEPLIALTATDLAPVPHY